MITARLSQFVWHYKIDGVCVSDTFSKNDSLGVQAIHGTELPSAKSLHDIFMKEIHIFGRIRHPNIITVIGAGLLILMVLS